MKNTQSTQANAPAIPKIPHSVNVPVLPSEGYVDIRQICTNRPKGRIGITPLSEPTIRRMVKGGRFPMPRRIGGRTVWAAQDIRAWLSGTA